MVSHAFIVSVHCDRPPNQCPLQYKAHSKTKHYELEEIETGGNTASRELIYKINKAAHGKRKSIAVGLESTAE